MKIVSTVIIISSLLVLVACTKQSTEPLPTQNINNNEQENVKRNEIEIDVPIVNELEEQHSEFSLYYNNNYLSLQDWDNEVNVIEILGSPESEIITVLDEGADTHKGSIIKRLSYDGLEITLSSPKQNGESFWIVSMNITDEKYSTADKVSVGDSLQNLKDTYATIEMFKDERTEPNNSAYIVVENEKHLLFEVEEGLVKEIEMYYEIN